MKRNFRLEKDKCALLVIDAQRYFFDEASPSCVPNPNKVLSNIKRLIEAFSRAQQPVILTRHIDEKDGLMRRWWQEIIEETDPMSQLHSDINASVGETLIKHQYDAFLGTNLERILRDKGVTQVVLCGVLTNLCCETTARSAFMMGFEVYFTTGATATYNQEMHNATLLNLSYGFATLMTVSDALGVMNV